MEHGEHTGTNVIHSMAPLRWIFSISLIRLIFFQPPTHWPPRSSTLVGRRARSNEAGGPGPPPLGEKWQGWAWVPGAAGVAARAPARADSSGLAGCLLAATPRSMVGSGSEARCGRDFLAATANGQGVRVARQAVAKEVTAAGASGAGVPSISVLVVVCVCGRLEYLSAHSHGGRLEVRSLPRLTGRAEG